MHDVNHIVRYSFPTAIYFGAKARNLLPDQLRVNHVRRPLVVTDAGLAKLPVFSSFLDVLQRDHLSPAAFSGIYGNPTLSQVAQGVQAYRAHNADAIVAIGGGAAMDVAKAIGLLAHHPGHLFDYEDGKADARPFDQPIPYLVALPTTSGTGSEVGRSTVISDDQTKVKKIIFDPCLLPKLVLADPELTLELPAHVTAATGMDALSHLLESFIAKGFHPICEGIALEGISIVARYLPKCVDASARDLHARGMMMNAAMMGAIAFQKGLGVTHSCAHALSTVCDLHHGLANGIMLPHAMTFNLPHVEEKFKRVSKMIDVGHGKAEDVIDWLRDLQAACQVPTLLREVGVKQSHLKDLVHYATIDTCHLSNPITVTSSDFEAIFKQAI